MQGLFVWEIIGLLVTATYLAVVRIGDPEFAPKLFERPTMGAFATVALAPLWPLWGLGLVAYVAAGKGSAR